ncbi:hypothetical protein CVIRNUC_003669 [Coccomyxa viridis]|uniref:Uncharacterized protein n=1 Tax=Coccomyxa viridis TaxID=1274662 RepID=A0AAV1HZ94_9CHLO|nr:hypothetical protein CVIRNUC_003669 [Coccomyxa viridis]
MQIFSVQDWSPREKDVVRDLFQKTFTEDVCPPEEMCPRTTPEPFEAWDNLHLAVGGNSSVLYTPWDSGNFIAVRVHQCNDATMLSKVVDYILAGAVHAAPPLAALVNLPPWHPHPHLELYPAPDLSGTPFTTARSVRGPSSADGPSATLSTTIDLGVAHTGDDAVTCHPKPVPIQLELTADSIRIDLPLVTWPLSQKTDTCLHLRWMGDVLTLNPVRPCMFLHSIKGAQNWFCGSLVREHFGLAEEPPDLYHFTLSALPLRDPYYSSWPGTRELHRLRQALAWILTRARRAARIIQRCWRRALYDPTFVRARNRLLREYAELAPL